MARLELITIPVFCAIHAALYTGIDISALCADAGNEEIQFRGQSTDAREFFRISASDHKAELTSGVPLLYFFRDYVIKRLAAAVEHLEVIAAFVAGAAKNEGSLGPDIRDKARQSRNPCKEKA